ncbi:hypothetical protein J1614_008342 [Plenodomus biglobosus]|nr:hypothetical protein J1614_008342 [Plenodomus biglobosus]
MGRSKRLLQMEAPAQNQWFGQPQYHQTVWQEQIPVSTQMQHPQPVAYPQMLHQGASPVFNAPQIPNVPHATAMPEAVKYPHYHEQARSEVRSDSTRSKDRAVQEDNTPIGRKRNRGADEVDYIHICDELPSIVLKNLKKSATESSTTSSSSSSSGGSDTTQEVPRVSIPRAGPPAAEGLPSQYPQYSYASARTYAPTTRQKPWTDDGAEGGKFKGKSRYASFEPMDSCAGQTRRPHIYAKYSEPSKAPIRH